MAATQPPARSRTAHTVPTTTTPDGRPLVFFAPAVGTALTGQAAKASGGSALQAGGPKGTPPATGMGGTILSDLLAADLANPTYGDRVATDADINAPYVIPGATNPPR
jgi:hypothetical protein